MYNELLIHIRCPQKGCIDPDSTFSVEMERLVSYITWNIVVCKFAMTEALRGLTCKCKTPRTLEKDNVMGR